MTIFLVTVAVVRCVPNTKAEGNEVARLLAKYLAGYTYSCRVVKVKSLRLTKSLPPVKVKVDPAGRLDKKKARVKR